MREAQVLPFRRPDLVVFERFDVDDMAALFRSKSGQETYRFTLLSDGTLEEAFIEQEQQILTQLPDFSREQKETMDRLVKYARDTMKDQLAVWHNLGAAERLSLLIEWGNDTIEQMKEAIAAAATADAAGYAEEIALMCKDLEAHESYLTGLDTARSLL